MEVDGGSACSGSWPALVVDPNVERTVSPRALIARGPITRHVRARPGSGEAERPRRAKTRTASEAVVEPSPAPSPTPRQVLYWRAAVIAAVTAVAASLLVVANGAPQPGHEDEPLAAVGAASPETATVLQPKVPEAAPADEDEDDALAEEVLYIEDDLDDEPVEPPPTDAVSAAKSASRSHARDAARLLTSRARAKRGAGDVAGAEKLLHDALDALPTYAPAAADLATLYIRRGEYERALAYAKRAARSAPRKLSYMVLLGDAQHLVGNHQAAVVQWRRAAHYGSVKGQERLAKHGGG